MAVYPHAPPLPRRPVNAQTMDDPRAIFLYTAPLSVSAKRFGVKKSHDLLNHWAICVGGYCYEMARNIEETKKDKKAPKHHIRVSREADWKERKDTQQRKHEKSPAVGYTAVVFSRETLEYIANRIWQSSLRGKYVIDEKNCQVFGRLFVDMIGDRNTKVNFPPFFDKWIKTAGITRDATALVFVAGASVVAAGASLLFTPVDPTGTAAAGFAVSSLTALRSTTALVSDRYTKEKYIEKAQKDLREELIRDRVIPG
ncbi:hypothetical protein F4777DRAFT_569343 [Nemania sp. FL0916]|nr:hypothetical protein F4777DRAFT_569343 [Nemania sp. FL0916]